ncbi:MAG: hypothetical protein WDA02_02205 [Saccharofermentanales bacterium]
MEDIKKFFLDVMNNKFKTRNGKKLYHDKNKLILDNRFFLSKEFLYNKYVINGQGIKSIIKDFNLPISYSVLRFYMINFFDIKLRDNKDITPFLRKRRSIKALNEKNNEIGFFNKDIQKEIKIKTSNKRGVQGYYYNKSLNKYVWLRSSWEYIYAKWLDKNKYLWDIEYKTFNISNNLSYRPDFFIFDNNMNIIKIVEIKGYWKDKLYKFNELKENNTNINIDIVLIDRIKPYTDKGFKKELSEWKKIRILKK